MKEYLPLIITNGIEFDDGTKVHGYQIYYKGLMVKQKTYTDTRRDITARLDDFIVGMRNADILYPDTFPLISDGDEMPVCLPQQTQDAIRLYHRLFIDQLANGKSNFKIRPTQRDEQ